MKKIIGGFAIGISGVGLHMLALWVADTYVESFPGVTDIVMRQLPFIDLFGIGEILFLVLMVGFGVILLRDRWCDLGYILALLGIFYACRGVFLILLPIGPPLDAPEVAERFVLYPYAGHAFFPGGHVGIMFILTLLVRSRTLRISCTVAVLLFGLGSIITRAHYTADIAGGLLLAYAVWAFGERYLKKYFTPQQNALPQKETF
ncbi:MAG: hypothetical protein WCV86_02450 [Patescibacteria group bacterium]|jgi:hypothetical protein